jgi:hypothetical protein
MLGFACIGIVVRLLQAEREGEPGDDDQRRPIQAPAAKWLMIAAMSGWLGPAT